MTKSNAGRKTVVTPLALQLLEEAFKIDCTDEEACLNADISTSTLYNYQNENPKFLERKKQLKNTPVLRARKCVVRHVEKSPSMAMKYLERKVKKEFSPKLEVENTNIDLNQILAGMDPKLSKAVIDSLKSKLTGEEGEDEL